MLMPLAILMKKKGCLIFREIYFNSCKKEFSTIANIKFKITRQQFTLSKFLDDITKNKTWDYNSYIV